MTSAHSALIFHYMYRDEQNRKTFGQVIFSNPERMSAGEAYDAISALMIDGELFVPNRMGVPTLYPHDPKDSGDHDYHELEGTEETDQPATDPRSIGEFISQLKTWKEENPEEFW